MCKCRTVAHDQGSRVNLSAERGLLSTTLDDKCQTRDVVALVLALYFYGALLTFGSGYYAPIAHLLVGEYVAVELSQSEYLVARVALDGVVAYCVAISRQVKSKSVHHIFVENLAIDACRNAIQTERIRHVISSVRSLEYEIAFLTDTERNC